MALPATPERRVDAIFEDKEVQKYVYNLEINLPSNNWESINKAVSTFKILRTKRLKYLRTTTSDIRNHYTQLPLGWIDNYQLIILIQSNADRYFQKLNAIMNQTGFPSN